MRAKSQFEMQLQRERNQNPIFSKHKHLLQLQQARQLPHEIELTYAPLSPTTPPTQRKSRQSSNPTPQLRTTIQIPSLALPQIAKNLTSHYSDRS